LRIFPAYIVIFTIASYALQTTYITAANGEDGFAGAGDTLGPINNWWHALLNLGMVQTFFPATLKTGLGVAWSLSAELCFYLLLPVLAWAAVVLVRRGVHRLLAVWFVPVFLVITGILGKFLSAATLSGTTPTEIYAQNWGPTWHAVLERSILPRADLFGYGAGAAILFMLIERQLLPSRAVTAVRITAISGFLIVGMLLVGPGLPSVLGDTRWKTAPIAAACAALILWAALPSRRGRPSWVGRICETKPLHYSGLVSYSTYLWHLPVLWWLEIRGLLFGPSTWGYVGNCVIVVAVTIALSSLTYHLIEAPALRLKKRTDGGKAAAAGPPVVAGEVHTPMGPDAVLPATTEH